MFEKGIYFCILYYLFFVNKIPANMAETRVMEEKEPDIEGEENLNISDDMEERRKEVDEENNQYRGKVLALRQDV